jgi:hypothetical protein
MREGLSMAGSRRTCFRVLGEQRGNPRGMLGLGAWCEAAGTMAPEEEAVGFDLSHDGHDKRGTGKLAGQRALEVVMNSLGQLVVVSRR